MVGPLFKSRHPKDELTSFTQCCLYHVPTKYINGYNNLYHSIKTFCWSRLSLILIEGKYVKGKKNCGRSRTLFTLRPACVNSHFLNARTADALCTPRSLELLKVFKWSVFFKARPHQSFWMSLKRETLWSSWNSSMTVWSKRTRWQYLSRAIRSQSVCGVKIPKVWVYVPYYLMQNSFSFSLLYHLFCLGPTHPKRSWSILNFQKKSVLRTC